MKQLADRLGRMLDDVGLGGVKALVGPLVEQVVTDEIDHRLAPLISAMRGLGYELRRVDQVTEDRSYEEKGGQPRSRPLRTGREPEGASRIVLDAVRRHHPQPVPRRTLLRELRPGVTAAAERDAIDNKHLKAVSRLIRHGLLEITDRKELRVSTAEQGE